MSSPGVAVSLFARRIRTDLERDITANHLHRLKEQCPESLETSSLHIDIARDLKRITVVAFRTSIADRFLAAFAAAWG